MYSGLRLDWIAAVREVIRSAKAHCDLRVETKTNPPSQEPSSASPICSLSNTDSRQLVDTMKNILLATVAILAFAAPSFAAEPAKTVGQAPPSGASSFYLVQDTATMKCQVVNIQPAAGGKEKVIGTAHPTQTSAETALTADKTCKS
jgi:hypothetical protein